MSPITYFFSRLLQIIPTFLIVMVIIFLLVRALPGDPAIAMADAKATAEQLEQIRQRLGLNEPLWIQFLYFVRNVFTGNLGDSILLKAPVIQVILERLPASGFLALYAVSFSLLIAGPLAFVAALNRNGWLDITVRAVFQIGLSTPVFYIGLLLLTFLAAQLRWFPVGGYGTTFWEHMYHLLLPALTVALYTSAIIMRNLRSSIIEVVDAEYVQFARAKGLPEHLVLGRHVLRNALISTVTLLGLSIGNLMSGTLVTETVFAVPGVGRLMLDAIFARDYPLIQGLTLMFTILVSMIFLLTDMIHAWLDPRMRVK